MCLRSRPLQKSNYPIFGNAGTHKNLRLRPKFKTYLWNRIPYENFRAVRDCNGDRGVQREWHHYIFIFLWRSLIYRRVTNMNAAWKWQKCRWLQTTAVNNRTSGPALKWAGPAEAVKAEKWLAASFSCFVCDSKTEMWFKTAVPDDKECQMLDHAMPNRSFKLDSVPLGEPRPP